MKFQGTYGDSLFDNADFVCIKDHNLMMNMKHIYNDGALGTILSATPNIQTYILHWVIHLCNSANILDTFYQTPISELIHSYLNLLT